MNRAPGRGSGLASISDLRSLPRQPVLVERANQRNGPTPAGSSRRPGGQVFSSPPPFLRLRWTGSPDEWAIGIYKSTTETYSENEFPWSYGPLAGTPEQGIYETLALCAGPPAGQ